MVLSFPIRQKKDQIALKKKIIYCWSRKDRKDSLKHKINYGRAISIRREEKYTTHILNNGEYGIWRNLIGYLCPAYANPDSSLLSAQAQFWVQYFGYRAKEMKKKIRMEMNMRDRELPIFQNRGP